MILVEKEEEEEVAEEEIEVEEEEVDSPKEAEEETRALKLASQHSHLSEIAFDKVNI